MLKGVWVSEELKKAVSLCYKIVKFEEVWHFKHSTVYDPETKKGVLFAPYMDRFFFKIIQESSGWPEGVITEEQKNTLH